MFYAPSPHLLCGPHPLRPGREMYDALIQEGVTCFVDLTEPGELPQYATPKIEYLHYPIPDFSTPSASQMIAILNALDTALAAGHTVYLHCHGGRGRTGTVVGCWLVRHGMTGERAFVRIAELRGDDKSPETSAQRQLVLNWSEK